MNIEKGIHPYEGNVRKNRDFCCFLTRHPKYGPINVEFSVAQEGPQQSAKFDGNRCNISSLRAKAAKSPLRNCKYPRFSSRVAMRMPISTKLCTQIEHVHPILHPINSLGSDPYFCARSSENFWGKVPYSGFAYKIPLVVHQIAPK